RETEGLQPRVQAVQLRLDGRLPTGLRLLRGNLRLQRPKLSGLLRSGAVARGRLRVHRLDSRPRLGGLVADRPADVVDVTGRSPRITRRGGLAHRLRQVPVPRLKRLLRSRVPLRAQLEREQSHASASPPPRGRTRGY